MRCNDISLLAARRRTVVKVAIVGCGKIADAHAAQIVRIPGSEIVAVCDRELLMARQLQERFPISAAYDDLDTLLREAAPDVVHITTSPESHYALARKCLEAGAHVYVEKPFTLYEHEAHELIGLAERRGLKITAGHDNQYQHVARRMRSLVRNGYLGGKPVHIESDYGYELGDNAYVRAFLYDRDHWVRRLPGMLLHNIISHGIARIAEFITCDSPTVITHAFVSPFLAAGGETQIMDELRVIIAEPGGATAYFTFSTRMRPSMHSLRLYGEKNGLFVDYDQELLIKLRGRRFKSFAEMFLPPLLYARQCIANLRINLRLFLRRDFHLRAGMKHLIESFYRSIESGTEPPIPYREILLTARIMDEIFSQINAQRRYAESRPSLTTAS
jgi:predicted dehydrogenase